VFEQIQLGRPVESMGLRPDVSTESVAETLPDAVTPEVVRARLDDLSELGILIVIVDEFDRLQKRAETRLFADTIKSLADFAVRATLILVGVADTVDELIEGHESVLRSLVQIRVPRMSQEECRKIVNDRLPRVGMTITPGALDAICILSRGLPHYTHLIGQHAAWRAIADDSQDIGEYHVGAAMQNAIQNAQHTIQSAHHRATSSPRKDALFREVLLACALAHADEFGYFTAADVRAPLRIVTGKDYDIPAFARHLRTFAGEARGEILQGTGAKYQRRFRFRNPLIQPYVVMRGIADGLLSLAQLRESFGDLPPGVPAP
jgi:hypothetical protein